MDASSKRGRRLAELSCHNISARTAICESKWLSRFRAELARLLGGMPEEIYKADSISLALLGQEERQQSLCWRPPRARPRNGGAR